MQHRFKLSLFITIAATALLTEDVRAEYTMSLEGWPDWVSKSMQQEKRKQKLRDVKMPDDTIRIKMPGKPDAPQAIEDGWYFVSDIKAESPLECYVYTTSLDPSSLTNILAENNIGAMEDAYGSVANRNIFHVDAGATNGTPYLALEWIYTVTGETQTLVAFTKVRVAVKGDMAFACTHNAIGYRETFATAFEAFVANIEYEESGAQPYYEEIATLDINGLGTGVAYMSYTYDEDGDTEAYSVESMLVPASANSLMFNDSVSISYSTPDLALISSVQVDVENGEITNNLNLQRNEDDNWVSSGTLQGKQVETEIDGALLPITDRGMVALARDLFAEEKQSADLNIWIPNADPTRFLEASITRVDTTENQAIIVLGPMQISGQFDEFGHMVTGEVAAGPITINIERVWSKGSIWE